MSAPTGTLRHRIRARAQGRTRDIAPLDLPKTPTRHIVALAAEIFELPQRTLLGRERQWPVAQARAAVCFVAYQQGWSSPYIGRILAGRCHSTVLHAVAVAYDRRQYDATFATRLLVLQDRARAPRRQLVVV